MKAMIAVLPGDGIGPEVVEEGVRVLRAIANRWKHEFTFEKGIIGGGAIDATGSALPAETVALCRRSEAVLLGAVGGPRWDRPSATVRPEQGLLGLRKTLDLFANLRPIRIFSQLVGASTLRREVIEKVDFLVVRELTGGIYFGQRQEGDERAYDTMVYTRPEVERIVRLAAQAAQGRRGKLTSVDKANVLASSRLWRKVTDEVVANEFPHLQLEHLLVDACAMHLIRQPSRFDVIVTGNLFGDILTDEAAMLVGSMGMLPSASLGEGTRGLYEPVHGSAPDIAGQGIANPLATILSGALLLRHSLSLEEEAAALEAAVGSVLAQGYRTPDLTGNGKEQTVGTREMGDRVIAALATA